MKLPIPTLTNQEVLSVCLRFVDIQASGGPQIREFLLDFVYLERATAVTISKKILECLSKSPVSLNSINIRGQA